jgi:hypothetical protein
MQPQTYPPYPPQQPQVPLEPRRKQPRRMRIWIAIVAASVAFVIGAAAAYGAVRATVKPTVVPVPGPTVTATPGPVTPYACLEALDLADDTISELLDILGLVPETVGAVLDGDASAMRRINKEMDKFDSFLDRNADDFHQLKDECREG